MNGYQVLLTVFYTFLVYRIGHFVCTQRFNATIRREINTRICTIKAEMASECIYHVMNAINPSDQQVDALVAYVKEYDARNKQQHSVAGSDT